MKKITIYLSGGLGNQMFQYAFGRAIAIKNSCELAIDNWSGFVGDSQYKRVYQLGNFPLKARTCNFIEKLPIWILKFEKYLFISLEEKKFVKRIYGEFRRDNNKRYEECFSAVSKRKNVWFLGYFQSPRYFESIDKAILEELKPPVSTKKNFLEMAKIIKSNESVALGIRLYEESKNPGFHAKDGKLKTIKELNLVIKKIIKLVPNPRFFVFSTSKSSILEKLNLPKNTIFLTYENGFSDAIDTIWLLSKCKHHIFTNSTFYWWGAWLSRSNFNPLDQLIFAPDNFKNNDTLPDNWNKF